MIRYKLQVDPSLLGLILPYLSQAFRESVASREHSRSLPPSSGDEELQASWKEGLEEEGRVDRLSLVRLFENPSLKNGLVEIPEEEAEEVLRSITDLRIFIREKNLESVSDEDLEDGLVEIPRLGPLEGTAYLGYLLLAEVQERLIAGMI